MQLRVARLRPARSMPGRKVLTVITATSWLEYLHTGLGWIWDVLGVPAAQEAYLSAKLYRETTIMTVLQAFFDYR